MAMLNSDQGITEQSRPPLGSFKRLLVKMHLTTGTAEAAKANLRATATGEKARKNFRALCDMKDGLKAVNKQVTRREDRLQASLDLENQSKMDIIERQQFIAKQWKAWETMKGTAHKNYEENAIRTQERVHGKYSGWLSEPVKYREGKLLLVGTAFIGVVAFVAWAINTQTGWVNLGGTVSPTALIIKTPPSIMMKNEWCAELDAAVAKIEGSAQENIPPTTWNTNLDALGSIWTLAYEDATRLRIKHIADLPIMGLDAPPAPPIAPVLGSNTTLADQERIIAQHKQDLTDHALVAFVQTIHLRHQLTQQHNDNIHQTAFTMIRNATELASNYFDEMYTVMYGRMDISDDCLGRIHEGQPITSRYKVGRALQTLRQSSLDAAVDLDLDARLALPTIAPVSAA